MLRLGPTSGACARRQRHAVVQTDGWVGGRIVCVCVCVCACVNMCWCVLGGGRGWGVGGGWGRRSQCNHGPGAARRRASNGPCASPSADARESRAQMRADAVRAGADARESRAQMWSRSRGRRCTRVAGAPVLVRPEGLELEEELAPEHPPEAGEVVGAEQPRVVLRGRRRSFQQGPFVTRDGAMRVSSNGGMRCGCGGCCCAHVRWPLADTRWSRRERA